MPRRKPQNVVILPARAGADTAPPASPEWLGTRRFWLALSAALPVVLDVLIDSYQRGEVSVPTRFLVPVALVIAVYHGLNKRNKEQGNTQDAAHLEAQGIPMGKPLDSEAVRLSLFSEFRMPKYEPPPSHSTR